MKKLPILLMLFSLCALANSTVVAQPKKEWVKAGSKVVVELEEEASSEEYSEGQSLKFKVTRPVFSENGVEVIRMNVSAIGRVKRIKEYEMEITVDAIQSIGGMDILVEGALVRKRGKRQCCIVFEKYTSITVSVLQDTAVKY